MKHALVCLLERVYLDSRVPGKLMHEGAIFGQDQVLTGETLGFHVMKQTDESRYHVQSAGRVLEVLEALAADTEPASLADLITRTGMAKSTVFRLIATLEDKGFVRKVAGGYVLGRKCIMLANAAREAVDLREEAQPQLRRLRDLTGETVQLAVLDDWQVVYLARMLSPKPVGYMRSRVGAVLPANCTGLGKAMLAYRSRPAVERWCRTQTFPRLTSTTLTSAEELLRELDVIAARGFALDMGEREPEVRCVAAPVRDVTGTVVAAISAAGPRERMSAELAASDLARHVVTVARALSGDLGCPPELLAGPP